MGFSLGKFLIVNANDRKLHLRNDDNSKSYTISVFKITSSFTDNNLLKIKQEGGNSIITCDFSTSAEARQALSLFQAQVDVVRTTTPFIIDKGVKNYINSIGPVDNVYDINVMTYSATVSNYGKDYFGVGYTASPVTINLPSITGIQDGKLVTIKDETGSSSINPITINTNGSETLDGSTQSQLAIDYGSLSFVKKSNGWWFI